MADIDQYGGGQKGAAGRTATLSVGYHAAVVQLLRLPDLPRWLYAAQPLRSTDRTLWWLSLIDTLAEEVMYTDGAGVDLVDRLVCIVERAAVEGALPETECTSRLAWIAAAVADQIVSWPVPVPLDPDAAVSRCLTQIGFDLQEAEAACTRPQNQPAELLTALHQARTLLKPVRVLRPYLRNEIVIGHVTRWLDVLEKLPEPE
jgi:hypothetical protein